MRLEDIGFYTLSDERARLACEHTPLHRCELLLTDRCNFRCPYCRGLKCDERGDLPLSRAVRIVSEWIDDGLRNVRFSGGEPMLYDGLLDLVKLCASGGVEHIAISTNGSASLANYRELIAAGVNDLSISLDACCSATGDSMAGRGGAWQKTTENMRKLSSAVYMTAGVVLTEDNREEAERTIALAHKLGCADIRIIPAAQDGRHIEALSVSREVREVHPILRYRLDNLESGRPVRGLSFGDYGKCPLVMDDMAVVAGKHYPCIIYLREQGDAIGEFTDVRTVRAERAKWYAEHDCYRDPICRNNCLDVCVDYNNRWHELHGGIA